MRQVFIRVMKLQWLSANPTGIVLLGKTLYFHLTGFYSSSFGSSDGQTNMGRRGQCLQTGVTLSLAGDSVQSEWGEVHPKSQRTFQTACGIECYSTVSKSQNENIMRKYKTKSPWLSYWFLSLLHVYLLCMFRIPGDLQQVVFNVAAQSDEGWTTLHQMYYYTKYDAEKRKMLKGLASTQDARQIVM